MYSSFSIFTFGVLLISILSENIESKATARSSSKVVECRVDSISCASRAGDGNIDFSYCNKDLDCNNSSHSSVSVCSLGSGKVPSSQKLDLSAPSMKDEGSGGSSTMIQISSSHSGSSKSALEADPRFLPKSIPITVCEKCFRKFLKVIGSVNNASWLRKLKAKSKGKTENKLISSTRILRSCTFSDFWSTAANTKGTTSVPPASNSRLSSLPLEPAGFSYDRGETIDIPLDTASGGSHNQDLNKKVQAKEAELKRIGSMPSVEHHSRYYNMDQRGMLI
ncbi:hypothetical protein F3Y22_tig00111659pilonHSYRG00070 [Hibiscus syriacus]|uniref:Uncharacterized protein n=1 Tax=Hibiscus syriacus TaxID=106335 RepID=A0A6A2YHS2_HIBSY|nr:hypothetical protein F3Y22_tig00111659pilonHSYRG00070 [Hibiscus syriacus]